MEGMNKQWEWRWWYGVKTLVESHAYLDRRDGLVKWISNMVTFLMI